MSLIRVRAFSSDLNSLSHAEVATPLDILCGAALDVGITLRGVSDINGYLEIRVDDEPITQEFLSFFRETLGCPVEVVKS